MLGKIGFIIFARPTVLVENMGKNDGKEKMW
jgi:hypothetical protein